MKYQSLITCALATCCLTVISAAGVTPPPVETPKAPEQSKWTFDASLNMFLAGMSGDVVAKGIPTEVDASFSDIFNHLEFGAAGRLTANYERWVLSTEFSYMKLEASTNLASLDMEQWLVEPSVGYRFCDSFMAFAGVRYNSISGDIAFNGPAGRVATGTQDWWDPIVGAQLSIPLSKKVSFDGRFDVGGFGAGSDLTWQAFPYLNWRLSERTSLQIGYRWLSNDYETGSGASRFLYDTVAEGPQLGFTFHF